MSTTASLADLETAPNKRASARQRVIKGAKITFGDFVFVRDCTVRDLSPGGARIAVSAAREVPNEFFLVVSVDRVMYRARVVWRRENALGVAFEGPPRDVMAESDPRLRQFQYVAS